MNQEQISQIRNTFKRKGTDELLNIWKLGNIDLYTDEAFEAIRLILEERGVEIPVRGNLNMKRASDTPKRDRQGEWLVKGADGSVMRYFQKDEIIQAVLEGHIGPDQDCCPTPEPGKNGKVKEPKWKKVSKSLARSSFPVRVLFQPVWAHSIRAGMIGAMLGVLVWLGSGGYQFFSINPPIALTIFYFFGLWALPVVKDILHVNMGNRASNFLLYGFLILLFICGQQYGTGPTIKAALQGFWVTAGASLGGALAGVFPGIGFDVGREGEDNRTP